MSRPAFRLSPAWRTPVLWGVAGALAIAVVIVAAYKAWPLLHPPVSERAPLNQDCDLHRGPCSVRFGAGGMVTFEITPRAIPSVHPLELQVTLRELPTPQRVEVDFVGVDMEMGFNRVALQRDADRPARADARPDTNRTGAATPVSPGPSHWRGDGMLPVCVRARMTWEARVLLHYPERLLAAPFRFETLRPGAR